MIFLKKLRNWVDFGKISPIDILNNFTLGKSHLLIFLSISKIWLKELLYRYKVVYKPESKLKEITKTGAIITDKEQNQIKISADTIVLSVGIKSRIETENTLEGISSEEYIIGDCSTPRNIIAAIHPGFLNNQAIYK